MIEDKIREIEEQAKRMLEEGQKLASLKETLEALSICGEKGHSWELGYEHKSNITSVFEINLICRNCESRVVMKNPLGTEIYWAMGKTVGELLGVDSTQEE